MLDYVCHHAIAWQVVLTKADKLSRQAALKAEREVMEVITQYADMYGHPALFPISVAAGLKPGDERMQCLENRIMEFISEQ